MNSSSPDSIELSLLGITPKDIPSESNLPAKFNQTSGRAVWQQVCKSPAFQKMMSSPHRNVTDVWLWCVRNYLRVCRSKGVYPFQSSSSQRSADDVYRMLVHARRLLVQYFEANNFFRRVNVIRTSRNYRFTPKEFWVISKAYLGPIEDPTFTRWLTASTPFPMFSATGQGGVYRRRLVDSSNVAVELELDLSFPMRPILWMSIGCPTPVTLSHSRQLLTGEQMVQYVENYIWLPLIRAFRIQHTNNRLF